MSGGRNGVCEALTAVLKERTVWDEEPCLYTMYQEPNRVHLVAWLPEGSWPGGRPADVLAKFSERLSLFRPDALAAITRPDFLGMAFRCEMWSVCGPERDAAVILAGHRPSQHPNRVETRNMWAVTRDGKHYVAFQNRGEKAITARRPDSQHGIIPGALERLVRAVTVGAN